MVITLPRTLVINKEAAANERVIELKVPTLHEVMKKNKVVSAFFTVLSAPVK